VNTSPGTLQRLRNFCLSLPETSETASWGHPNFRAGKQTFAAFEYVDGRPSIAMRLGRGSSDPLLEQRDFFPTPYGRGQWISLWADIPVNWRLVEQLILKSYRTVALKRMLAALDTMPNAEHTP
jgi:predicted DNA-binding protein (MmcQ/YjbR family)